MLQCEEATKTVAKLIMKELEKQQTTPRKADEIRHCEQH